MSDLPIPQEVRDRYKQVEIVADKFGRTIKVGRLRPSEQTKIREMGVGSAVMALQLVAMVRGIDDEEWRFPKTRAELDARMDRLEDEGIEAVSEALPKLFPDQAGDGIERAKN